MRSDKTETVAALTTHPTSRRAAQPQRRKLTAAELLLWSKLKGRQIGGFQFLVQHPIGPHILDFACERLRLAIELEDDSAPTPETRAFAERRAHYLAGKGWTLKCFSNKDVLQDIAGVLHAIRQSTQPNEGDPSHDTPDTSRPQRSLRSRGLRSP